MDCNVFEKKLMDLIEDNISHDLKDAMLQHMENCEHCKALYNEEMNLEQTFKIGLATEGIYFNSSRGDIMKNIDKNRYGKNPMKKLNYHIKKFSGLYAAAAVLIIATSFIIPYVLGNNSKKDLASSQISAESKASGSATKDSTLQSQEVTKMETDNNQSLKSDPTEKKAKIAIPEDPSAPNLKKTVLQKTVEPSFNTPWENSPNKKMEVTIEGKGSSAQEEGVGKIFVKDLTTNGRWIFEIIQDIQKGQQDSPKFIKWVDDDNFLVIIGYGYGSITRGGAIYLVNANTGKLVNADIERKINLKEGKGIEITKILDINANELKLEAIVFEDDNKMKSHMETRTINFPYDQLKDYIK